MALLTLLAILLAIPTYGLSIIALFVWIFFCGKACQKKLSYENAERQTLQIISRGEHEYPSWIQDPYWQKTFVDSTFNEAIKHGMSKAQATQLLTQQDWADSIMTLTAQLEKANFSKLGQISGAMEFTGKIAATHVRRWNTE